MLAALASLLSSDVRLTADGRLLKGFVQVAAFDGWQAAHAAWQMTFTQPLAGKDRARAVRLVRERCGDEPLILRFRAQAPRWRRGLARHLTWAVARHV